MNQPIIFVIDDDVQVLRAITRDLKNKYRQDYRVLSTSSAKEILGNLLELKNKGESVAMFISDQRMPEMEGVDFLTQAMEFYDDAKKVLLTAYSDTDAAIKAINTVKLDYYLPSHGIRRKKNYILLLMICSMTGRIIFIPILKALN